MVHEEVDIPRKPKQALNALSLLSKKWHPVVICVLSSNGTSGFNHLQEAIPGVSGKVLSETLDDLEQTGLVSRTVISESPLRVEYELTDAGKELESVFAELADWAAVHLDGATPTVLIVDRDRRISEMYREWLADRYEVISAHNSAQVNKKLDDSVDAVLFSRRVPGVDPSKVPTVAPSDCRSILLVAENRSPDEIEIDCDSVLSKPVVRETLLDAIETQLSSLESAE